MGDFEQIVLLQLISENIGIHLHELQEKFCNRFGVWISVPTICRTLKNMGCSRRVIRHIALQRSDELRAEFMAEMSLYDADMLIWIDESGCDRRNSARKYAYTIEEYPVDHSKGTSLPAAAAATVHGHDVMLVEGNVNGDVFAKFVETSLVPILQPFGNPNSIIVMDNASIHHVDQVTQLVESTGASLFLPYSPDLNPVEQIFSKVKCVMKEHDQLFQVFSEPRVLLTMHLYGNSK